MCSNSSEIITFENLRPSCVRVSPFEVKLLKRKKSIGELIVTVPNESLFPNQPQSDKVKWIKFMKPFENNYTRQSKHLALIQKWIKNSNDNNNISKLAIAQHQKKCRKKHLFTRKRTQAPILISSYAKSLLVHIVQFNKSTADRFAFSSPANAYSNQTQSSLEGKKEKRAIEKT